MKESLKKNKDKMNIRYSVKIVLFLILISCKNNGQENPINQKKENETNMKISNTYKLNYTSKEDIFNVQKFLSSKNFKSLDDTLFKNKIIEKFNVNIDTIGSKNSIVYEEATLDPNISTDAILYTTAYRGNKFMVPIIEDLIEPFFSDRTKFEDFPTERKDILYHFNNWVFYDNKASFTYLKTKKPWTFMHLINDYGYVGNDEYTRFILKNIGEGREAQDNINEMVISWAPRKNRFEIRKTVIEKIIEFQPDLVFNIGMIVSDYAVYTIKSKESKNSFLHTYETEEQKLEDFSYLMNVLVDQGMVGILDELYNENPMVLGLLKKNNFYGYEDLKNYSLHAYGQTPYDEENPKPIYEMAVINDPDGYTNVRDSSGEVVFKIKDGEEFMVSKSDKEIIGDFYKDGWWYVRFQGKNGWIHNSRVKIVAE